MESTYLLIIFLIRSLITQYDRTISVNPDAQNIGALVLTTHIHWFQNVMLCFTRERSGLRTDRPRYIYALSSPFIAYVTSLTYTDYGTITDPELL